MVCRNSEEWIDASRTVLYSSSQTIGLFCPGHLNGLRRVVWRRKTLPAMTTTAQAFRNQLRARLERSPDRVMLRIALSPTLMAELTARDILEQSRTAAARYAEGAAAGSVVLLLLPHSLELFLLQIGLVLSGRIPAVLAWPTSRVDANKYRRNLIHQLGSLPAERLITLPSLAETMAGQLPYPAIPCRTYSVERWEQVFASKQGFDDLPAAARRERPAMADRGDALFLQFSGGTTGAQKAVVITANILEAQLMSLVETLAFGSEDSVVSWLPLYHDMGLIACLWLPLWCCATSLHFAATDWLLNPGLLFEYIERFRATFTWLPNFAFSYLASQFGRIPTASSLHSMRAWINCSEPVRGGSVRAFVDRYVDWGVRAESVQACYAMAENVFAVTQTTLGEPLPTCARESRASEFATPVAFGLSDDHYLSSGRPLRGMDIHIVHPQSGKPCAEGEAGDIHLKTVSLFQGYWGSEGFTTHAFTSDGWYATGDFGFVLQGELFVIGRLKDIIIVAGQNVFPEDVELAANAVDGVYPGRVASFGVIDEKNGTESLVVVAELRGDFDPDKAQLVERAIHQAVLTNIGIAPRQVLVVPDRWIVKSTAGKIARLETRARFLREITSHSHQRFVSNQGVS